MNLLREAVTAVRESVDGPKTYPLLKFTGAMEHDPSLHAWFATKSADLAPIARRWFARMRSTGPDVRELLHDGCATVCVEDAPFAYVNVFTAHVNVGFFHGAMLRDPSRLLEGSGKRMRHVRLQPDLACDAGALERLIAAAYADVRSRLAAQ